MKQIRITSSRLALFLTMVTIGLSGCNLPEKGGRPVPASTGAFVIPDETASNTASPTQMAAQTENSLEPSFTAVVPSRQTSPASPDESTPTPLCDQAGAGNPIDVSIPDDSQILPGQVFTKVWRLQNVGACTWTREYRVALFSGEAMGAQPSLPLPEDILPGESVEISVDMIAPQTPGEHQGNWKLLNPSNEWFGIGPDGSAPFWVRILVVELSPTATATIPPALGNTH